MVFADLKPLFVVGRRPRFLAGSGEGRRVGTIGVSSKGLSSELLYDTRPERVVGIVESFQFEPKIIIPTFAQYLYEIVKIYVHKPCKKQRRRQIFFW